MKRWVFKKQMAGERLKVLQSEKLIILQMQRAIDHTFCDKYFFVNFNLKMHQNDFKFVYNFSILCRKAFLQNSNTKDNLKLISTSRVLLKHLKVKTFISHPTFLRLIYERDSTGPLAKPRKRVSPR